MRATSWLNVGGPGAVTERRRAAARVKRAIEKARRIVVLRMNGLRSELPGNAKGRNDAHDRIFDRACDDRAVTLRLEGETVHAGGVGDVENVEEIDEERERAAARHHAPRRAEIDATVRAQTLRA